MLNIASEIVSKETNDLSNLSSFQQNLFGLMCFESAQVCMFSTYFSYRIHVCYIYLHCYMYHQNQTNLGKYTICCPMNPSWDCFRLEKAAETEGFKMTLLKLGWARNGPKPSWGVLEIDGYVKLPGCTWVKLVGFRKHQQKVLIIVFFLHLNTSSLVPFLSISLGCV